MLNSTIFMLCATTVKYNFINVKVDVDETFLRIFVSILSKLTRF